MNLCSNGHDAVCYEGHLCPACELKDRIKELEAEKDDLQLQIDDLKSQE